MENREELFPRKGYITASKTDEKSNKGNTMKMIRLIYLEHGTF